MGLIKIAILFILSCLVSVLLAGAGDELAGLPISQERELHTLFDAYRADPIYWGKNFFKGLIITNTGKYKSVTPIPFVNTPGFDQSAHDHAAQMATEQWSPLNCSDDNSPPKCANASDPKAVCQPPCICCLRDQDCANVSLGSINRLQYYGWAPKIPYGAGGAVARGAADALTAVLSILCDYFGQTDPTVCVPDSATNVRDLLLRSNFYNGGFGYAPGSSLVKEPPYWAITFSSNSQNGNPTWTNYLTSGSYAHWFFRGNSSLATGTGAFIATYSDGTHTTGPNKGAMYVVLNGVKQPMMTVNNNNRVWIYNGTYNSVDYSNYVGATGAACTHYYFMFLQGSTTRRYPEGGNLLMGTSCPGGSATYEVDGSTCTNCAPNAATCFQSTCVCLSGTPPCSTSPASTIVISFALLVFSVCVALL